MTSGVACPTAVIEAPTPISRPGWAARVPSFLAVTLIALLCFVWACDGSLFNSDAADYLSAARSGFWSLYGASGSRGLWRAVSIYRNEPQARAHVWAVLERRNDAAAMFHFHVSAGFYPTAVAATLGAGPKAQRMVVAAEGALAIGLLFAVLCMAGVAAPLAAVAAVAAAASPAVILASSDISPHPLFFVAALGFAYHLAKYLEAPSKHRCIVVAIWLAGAIAVLELSLVLIAGLIPILACFRRMARIEHLRAGVPAFLGALLVAWPGGRAQGRLRSELCRFWHPGAVEKGRLLRRYRARRNGFHRRPAQRRSGSCNGGAGCDDGAADREKREQGLRWPLSRGSQLVFLRKAF